MQTHCLPRMLDFTDRHGEDARIFFAIKKPERIFIFIHGYSGAALRTWSNFSGLLPTREAFRKSDILFYGYDALNSEIYASSAIFRGFLNKILDDEENISRNLPLSLSGRRENSYGEIIIVAHSLGAVIARRAILDATVEKKPWVEKVSLVLYAPAHKGANVVRLAADAIAGWPIARLLEGYLRFKSPLIDQLKPDSDFLRELLSNTEAMTDGGNNRHLVARRVLIAEKESIVSNEIFSKDPLPCGVQGATHTTVCKPRIGFLHPLHLLEECL